MIVLPLSAERSLYHVEMPEIVVILVKTQQHTKALGLGIAGVDMLQSNDGPKVMEVNSSPGLEGIEAATGKDIAKAIIRYIERSID